MKHVEKVEGGCWNWTACKDKDGYGVFQVRKGLSARSHRWMFSQHHSLESNQYILHSCDNPACVNPEHLRCGTPAENMRDKVERGRWKGGRPLGSKCKEKHTRVHIPKACPNCSTLVYPAWMKKHLLICQSHHPHVESKPPSQ